ncbi:MAG: alkaline phosphatase family protein [Actinomycetota bacterium]|nr:alkaline phosphatase family protein [Actinomycetota bacterium]
MPSITVPDYSGGSLVNLVAELEQRLTGSSASSPLHDDLSALIPEAETYVLFLFDGLGTLQLDHPAAAAFAGALKASLDSPFPATTTVSLATIATGLPPSQHGLLGYQLWIPEVEQVVNTIKWTTLWGKSVAFNTGMLLPAPNLWERLRGGDVESITVQPGNFMGTPLSKALYRGCRYEPAFTVDETIDATVQLASEPGRLVLAYLPHVDFAAHVYGQNSQEYGVAVATVADAWERVAVRLPDGAAMIGTADHGHVDFPKDRQIRIPKSNHTDRTFYGDGRVMFVKGEGASLAEHLPATWIPLEEMIDWWGPGPRNPSFDVRAPDGVLVADDGFLLLHSRSDDRMTGNHGALTDAERLIPLLVAD